MSIRYLRLISNRIYSYIFYFGISFFYKHTQFENPFRNLKCLRKEQFQQQSKMYDISCQIRSAAVQSKHNHLKILKKQEIWKELCHCFNIRECFALLTWSLKQFFVHCWRSLTQSMQTIRWCFGVAFRKLPWYFIEILHSIRKRAYMGCPERKFYFSIKIDKLNTTKKVIAHWSVIEFVQRRKECHRMDAFRKDFSREHDRNIFLVQRKIMKFIHSYPSQSMLPSNLRTVAHFLHFVVGILTNGGSWHCAVKHNSWITFT